MPGRGEIGAPGALGRGCESLAARSGRGGTMGRTAGCPARPGRVGVRRPGAGPPATGEAGGCMIGVADRAAGAADGPLATRIGSAGRTPPGSGCLGPDKIWPGRGAAGMGLGGCGTGAEGTGAGAPGIARGGRSRCDCGATRCAKVSSARGSRGGSASRVASGVACGAASGWACGASVSSATAEAEPFELVCAAGSRAPPPPKMRRS
jgi:hypothetical protein